MPATTERTERELVSGDVDPAPPTVGADGFPVRIWKVDGVDQEFSLKPFPPDDRPVYWYIGMGAHLRVKAQTMNQFGIQPTIMNDVFVDGSFSPRNAWEEHVTREFLRDNHVDPDKSRNAQHPEGPGHYWRCECGYRCPSYHVMTAHQLRATHKNLRSE